jgi:hypothetical protein
VSKSAGIATLVAAWMVTGAAAAHAQGMLLDYAADRVIQKYQTSSCEQLKQMRSEPQSEKENWRWISCGVTLRLGAPSSTRLPRLSPTRCSSAACSHEMARRR